MQAQRYIDQLKQQWIGIFLLQGIALSLGIALLVGSLCNYALATSAWVYIVVFFMAFVLFFLFRQIWKIDRNYVIRYLDHQFVELEESASLLIKPEHERNLLENLQAAKITSRLPLKRKIKGGGKILSIALSVLLIGLLAAFAFSKIPARVGRHIDNNSTKINAPLIKEQVPPQVENYLIQITPPSYTNNPVRMQKQFYISVEMESLVRWELKTNHTVQSMEMIFNDRERVKLNLSKKDERVWLYSRKIDKQGFYQLELDGQKSDLYQIDVIPDLPVNIQIKQPKPETVVDFGQEQSVRLAALLNDDYGISDAYITATMASGKGESVSFTEKKLSFNTTFNNRKSIALSKQIDLNSLGMKPGDELYFFINARDNKGQQSRSDVYRVALVDTAELMSMAGMTSGVNLVPEYFRSERQIIIDTEKLLAEQKMLSASDFKSRSNELGVDQKLLRLRYGQFLGEENETQIGGSDEHEDHEGHAEETEKFGDVQALMDKYAHKHDIAEDATFFEPEIKAQLKAVLNEMWNAELKLRTFKPQEALPFEYKALRLLKDLQQKSRAYVAKTTVKTASLKLEKRLTGELDKVIEPQQRQNLEANTKIADDLRLILALLSAHPKTKPFNSNEKALLKTAEKQILSAAAKQPATYLAALTSIRKLNTQSSLNKMDTDVISKALDQILGSSNAKPKASYQVIGAEKKLASSYFNNLKKY